MGSVWVPPYHIPLFGVKKSIYFKFIYLIMKENANILDFKKKSEVKYNIKIQESKHLIHL
jgi:hypothetical protein